MVKHQVSCNWSSFALQSLCMTNLYQEPTGPTSLYKVILFEVLFMITYFHVCISNLLTQGKFLIFYIPTSNFYPFKVFWCNIMESGTIYFLVSVLFVILLFPHFSMVELLHSSCKERNHPGSYIQYWYVLPGT